MGVFASVGVLFDLHVCKRCQWVDLPMFLELKIMKNNHDALVSVPLLCPSMA